jgi:hypothetical protein
VRDRVHGLNPARSTRSAVGGVLLALGCLAVGQALTRSANAQELNAYQVKAAFLYNFAKFVEWPEEANDPLDICTVGDEPFGRALEDTVKGKTVKGRPVEIKRIKSGATALGCKIAFIGSSERGQARSIFASLQGANTLTVGEWPDFAKEGGIVSFTLENNQVHFEINVDAAERAHLKISSKLLSLAKIIKE